MSMQIVRISGYLGCNFAKNLRIMGKITLTILKPDAVANGHTGKIIDHIIQAGFKVRAMKLIQLDEKIAGNFYGIHRERPFFKD